MELPLLLPFFFISMSSPSLVSFSSASKPLFSWPTTYLPFLFSGKAGPQLSCGVVAFLRPCVNQSINHLINQYIDLHLWIKIKVLGITLWQSVIEVNLSEWLYAYSSWTMNNIASIHWYQGKKINVLCIWESVWTLSQRGRRGVGRLIPTHSSEPTVQTGSPRNVTGRSGSHSLSGHPVKEKKRGWHLLKTREEFCR